MRELGDSFRSFFEKLENPFLKYCVLQFYEKIVSGAVFGFCVGEIKKLSPF